MHPTFPPQVRAGVRDLKKAQSMGLALDPGGVELVECDVVKQSVRWAGVDLNLGIWV